MAWVDGIKPAAFVAGLPDAIRETFKRAVSGAPCLARGICDSFQLGELDTMRQAFITLTGSATEIEPVYLNPTICGDMLVTDRAYSIEQPNFPPSFWRAQRLKALTEVPGIDIQVSKYAQRGRILADWVPIQNWARPATLPRGNNGCPSCWILRFCDQLAVSGKTTRTLEDGENPTIVRMTFEGMLFVKPVDMYDPAAAREWLADQGFGAEGLPVKCRCGRGLDFVRRGETSYAAADPDLQGIGASPSLGGISGWQFIPTAQLDDQACYQFDLGSFEIGGLEVATIVNLREGLTIGETTGVTLAGGPGGDPPADAWVYVEEKIIDSPYWHLSDGFVRWGVRVYPGSPRLVGTRGNFAAPGVRAYPFMGSPARLVRPTTGGSFDEPLDQGGFPGVPLGTLGDMPSKNFPWQYTNDAPIAEHVQGPALVSFQAYVRQSNPLTRPTRFDSTAAAPSLTTLQTLAFGADPEEAWLLGHLRAQYRHIAGVMLYEIHRYGCGDHRTCGSCCKHEHASTADTSPAPPPSSLTTETTP